MVYTGFLAGPPVIGALAEVASLRAGLGLVALLAASAVVLAPAITRPVAGGAPGTAT